MKQSGDGWLVCDTFFNKQGTRTCRCEACLHFTCVPKTFSRKLFMHFAGIEQLAKRTKTGAAAIHFDAADSPKMDDSQVRCKTKKNLLLRIFQRAKRMPARKDSSQLKNVAEPKTLCDRFTAKAKCISKGARAVRAQRAQRRWP